MNLSQFARIVNLSQKTEIEKVKLVAFFENATKGMSTFIIDDIIEILSVIGHHISNKSRLKQNLAKSKAFKKISNGEYAIIPSYKEKLHEDYDCYFNDENEIVSNSEILDESLFLGKRGYLDKLIKQINHCYKYNCYDACAVCMRRIFEIILILAFEKKGLQNEIQNDGDYINLEAIISKAQSNKVLNLSKSKKYYDEIRLLGNYSAHKRYYNARRMDIDNIKIKYRVCLEELYYLAGFIE